MVFEVGRRLFRPGAGERAQLAGGHGQRAAAVVQVAQAHAHLAQHGARNLVKGAGVFQLVDQAQLQVILQVATDAGQLVQHVDTQGLEHAGRADAGALQDAGRTDGARAQDDFLARPPCNGLALLASNH